MKMQYSPSMVARMFRFVREAAEQNTGLRVEAIQRWSTGSKGDSWCCEFATMVLDICYQGDAPVGRTGVCQDVYDLAQKNGWVVTEPKVDDLFFYVNDAGHAHHIGIVTGVEGWHADSRLSGIAGNTSEDGTSSNGNGVYEHPVKARVFARLPR